MPQVLIIEACVVNYSDDRGGIHQDAGDLIEPNKDTALALVRAGRALYTKKTDDPDKNGRNTASAEMLKAANDMAKAKGKATAKPKLEADPADTPPAA